MRTARCILLLVLLFTVDKCPQHVLGYGIGFSAQVNPTNAINIELSSKAVKEKIPTAIHSILGNFLTKQPNAETIRNPVDNAVLNSPPTGHHVESTTSSSFESSTSSTTERHSEKTTESIGTHFGLEGEVFDSRPLNDVLSSTTERPIEFNLGGFFMADLNGTQEENVGSMGQGTEEGSVLNTSMSGPLGSLVTSGGIGLTSEENLLEPSVDPHAIKLGRIELATGGELDLGKEKLVLNVSAGVSGIVGELSVGTSESSHGIMEGIETVNEENMIPDDKAGATQNGAFSNIVSDVIDIVLGPKVPTDVAVSSSGSSDKSIDSSWSANPGQETGEKLNLTQEGITLNIVSEVPVLDSKVTAEARESILTQTTPGHVEESNVTQETVILNVASKLPRLVDEPDVTQHTIVSSSAVSGPSIEEELELVVPTSDTFVPVSGEGGVGVEAVATSTLAEKNESVPSAASVGLEGSAITEEAIIPTAEVLASETVENANSITEGVIIPTLGVNMELRTEGSVDTSLIADSSSSSASVQQLQEMGGTPDVSLTSEGTAASVISEEPSLVVKGSAAETTIVSETDLTTASQTINESNSNNDISESTLVHSDNRSASAKSLLSSEKPVHSASETVFPESHKTPTDLSPPILCTEAGNFSVAGNCHVYISCSAVAENFSRQVLDCPDGTAFSPLVRRCSRDISPCENHEPACIKSGTIPDPSNSSLYYWCIPSLIGGFHKYHVQCSVTGCLHEEYHLAPNKLTNTLPSDRDVVKSEWKQLKKEIKVLVKVEKIRQKMEAKAKARIDKLVADKLKKQKRPAKKDEDSDDDDDDEDDE